MHKRPKALPPAEAVEILARMKACREAMTELQTRIEIRSAAYREAQVVVRDIDTLAQLITGDPGYFKLRGHGGGFVVKPD